MTDKFILGGPHNRDVVPVDDLLAWAQWYGNADRHVAVDVRGDVRVSTGFLGVNHNWREGPPLLFETMIFGGPHDQHQERCPTWEEAEAMHAKAVQLAFGEHS